MSYGTIMPECNEEQLREEIEKLRMKVKNLEKQLEVSKEITRQNKNESLYLIRFIRNLMSDDINRYKGSHEFFNTE